MAAALCAPGCDGTSSVAAPSTGGAEGAECSPAQPCEGALLCLDGRCRVRAGAPDATAAPGTVVPPIPDGLWDDVALPDVATPDTGDASSGPDLDGPETADLPDTSSDAGDGGGPGDVGPSGDAIVLVFSEDEAELHPGDQALSIELGQGWVTELTVPYAGSIVGMQVMLINAFGPGSCARFAPAIWLPNAAGEFEDAPTWRAENGLALVGGPKPVSFFLSQKVQSKAGRIRLGLILNGPCETVSPLPLMASDDSGDLSRTWLWAPDATGSPWIDGELVGIDGRWGIAVLIEVVL
ncbi:MAG: hypothetical protein R3F39_09880 [Myxococcota bacterium]